VDETPNSWKANQYDNPSNAVAHYESTGPEIWKQTDGKITHFVVGVGTGGTISGVAKYLKEQNPDIKVIGIDTYGSVFKKYHETGEFDEKEIYPYITEGIGEDMLPENVDFGLIDHFEKVTDKDAAIYTREIALREGIFVGNSAGAAVAGMRQVAHMFDENSVVVVLFHDHGSRYVGKMFNDEWMRERGFLSDQKPMASDLLSSSDQLISVDAESPVIEAIKLMRDNNISQLPVMAGDEIVGTITESGVFRDLIEDPDVRQRAVKLVMEKPLPIVASDTDLESIASQLRNGTSAVLVDMNGKKGILTKQDIISKLS
jgi:cystathionine beta-synthase